jgi:hypothetical protein
MGANAEDEGGEAIDFNSSDEKRSRALEAAKQAGRRKLY